MPTSIDSAFLALTGVGPTQPKTMRAVLQASPDFSNVRRTATPTDGLSTTELLEKRMYSMPERGGSGGSATWVNISS